MFCAAPPSELRDTICPFHLGSASCSTELSSDSGMRSRFTQKLSPADDVSTMGHAYFFVSSSHTPSMPPSHTSGSRTSGRMNHSSKSSGWCVLFVCIAWNVVVSAPPMRTSKLRCPNPASRTTSGQRSRLLNG